MRASKKSHQNISIATEKKGKYCFFTWAPNSIVCCQIWLKFKLIQAFIHVLLTCKKGEHPIENEDARVDTKLYIDFSNAQEQIIPESVVRFCRDSNPFKHLCMSSIPTRKKKNKSKIKALDWPRHFSYFKSVEIFPDIQGQVTPQSAIGTA